MKRSLSAAMIPFAIILMSCPVKAFFTIHMKANTLTLYCSSQLINDSPQCLNWYVNGYLFKQNCYDFSTVTESMQEGSSLLILNKLTEVFENHIYACQVVFSSEAKEHISFCRVHGPTVKPTTNSLTSTFWENTSNASEHNIRSTQLITTVTTVGGENPRLAGFKTIGWKIIGAVSLSISTVVAIILLSLALHRSTNRSKRERANSKKDETEATPDSTASDPVYEDMRDHADSSSDEQFPMARSDPSSLDPSNEWGHSAEIRHTYFRGEISETL